MTRREIVRRPRILTLSNILLLNTRGKFPGTSSRNPVAGGQDSATGPSNESNRPDQWQRVASASVLCAGSSAPTRTIRVQVLPAI